MQNNILRRLIFASQIGFFVLLVGSAVMFSIFSQQQTHAEANGLPGNTTANKEPVYPIQPAPWYGSLSTGLYITDPNPSAKEKLLDHKASVLSWFVHWDGKMDNEKLAYACSHGYVPQITWESRTKDEIQSSRYSLDDIIAGKYDQFIRDELESVKKTCKDQSVIIRFDHEMDTKIGRIGWYPWQGNPEQYIAAWKHVVSISHEISPTIKWLWSPNRGVQVTKQYYPGEEWVDYVGITINRNPKQFHYNNFGTFYGDNQLVIESFGKPIIISETTYDQEGGTAALKAEWINSMAAYIATNPKIVSVSWFESRIGQSFESSPESIAALKVAYKALESRK